MSTNSFSTWWMSEGRLIAAFIMNRPDEERDAAPKWIENEQKLSSTQLRDQSHTITEAAN